MVMFGFLAGALAMFVFLCWVIGKALVLEFTHTYIRPIKGTGQYVVTRDSKLHDLLDAAYNKSKGDNNLD